ncbi:hypothetical protein ASE68_10810 [Agromyces sp. Leaf222]|nr:hypothetical protein ASE68_10810 [Agromyces sp. Leaf222]
MIATHTSEPVVVWLDEAGAPTRLVFRNLGYRVIDTPTRLPHDAWLSCGSDHSGALPDRSPLGWRVTGRSSHDEILVFDLRLQPTGWIVENVFA